MRSIKFRAWSKLGDEMLKQEDIRHLALAEFEMKSNLVFMQYTGLKDKNGVDIYDGDIFKTDEDKHLKVVEFERGMFIAKYIENKNNIASLSYFDSMDIEIEIIGNIHENPELLNN